MFAFMGRLFKKKDPRAVDRRLVRRYLHTHSRFEREYRYGSFSEACRLYDTLWDLRAAANQATNGAINQAFGLPADFYNPA